MTDRRNEALAACELAVANALLIVTAEQTKPSASGLGFAQINYGRLFIRDKWTLFALARELNCDVADFLPAPEKRSSEVAHWRDLLAASEVLLHAVNQSERTVRLAILLRACGASWRRVAASLPGRVLFSLSDDVDQRLTAIVALCKTEVATLSAERPRSSPRSRNAVLRKIRLQDAAECASSQAW